MSLAGKQRSSMTIRIIGSILLDMEPRFALLGRFCMPAICAALGSTFTEVKAHYLTVSTKRSLDAPKISASQHQLKPIPGLTDRSKADGGHFFYPGFESALTSIDRLQLQQYIRSQSYFDSVNCLRSELRQLERDRVNYEEDLLVIYKRQSATRSTLERVLSLWRYETLRSYFFRFRLMLVRKKARSRFSRACVYFNRMRPGGPPAPPMLLHVWCTWRKFAKDAQLSRIVQQHKTRQELVERFKHKIHVHNNNAVELRKRIGELRTQFADLSGVCTVRCRTYTSRNHTLHRTTHKHTRTRTHTHI